MNIFYFNGKFKSTDEVSVNNLCQCNSFVCEATNEGFPFRGTPTDMANDALMHLGVFSKFLPVIFDLKEGTDEIGRYTTSVTFEAVKSPF